MKAKLLVLSFLLLAVMLVGCGGGSSAVTEPSYIVNILVYGTTTDTAAVDTFSANLNTAFPELAKKVDGIGCTQYANGTSPDGITANMNKISMDMTAKKLCIIIADKAGMQRLVASDVFKPISEVFTAEELATITYQTLKYQKTDADGNAVGDPVEFGWDVSGSAVLKGLIGDDSVGIGMVAEAPQQGYTKQVLLHLLTQS